MCGGSPSAPVPPPRAPEAAQLPTAPVGRGGRAEDARRRRAAAGGEIDGRSTILTGARGVQDGAVTAQKTLLGQ